MSAERIKACLTRELSATARTMPTMCHKMPKSPSAVAVANSQIVGLKFRVGSKSRSNQASNAASLDDLELATTIKPSRVQKLGRSLVLQFLRVNRRHQTQDTIA